VDGVSSLVVDSRVVEDLAFWLETQPQHGPIGRTSENERFLRPGRAAFSPAASVMATAMRIAIAGKP
jgi:hypothetical protein